MKPADDSKVNYKDLVQRGYNSCAAEYDTSRQREAGPELTLLTSRLRDGATILDVGCGAGVPIARTLSQRFAVTGVDISGEMISRARANVPQATFIKGDIMSVELPPSHLDAAVAFYSIFHLPREEHPELLRRIYRWLKPGGYLLATLSYLNEAPYTEDYLGVTMYWSNYGLEDYKRIIEEIGFTLLKTTVVGHGYREEVQASEERHPLIFARKA
ncbi:MAG TPA: methyltransferase domain-containing protein [Dehalococcoidia bacterium]|nr:methyltransferase domain-containing protein [Dehalococcoidia bacterium]